MNDYVYYTHYKKQITLDYNPLVNQLPCRKHDLTNVS